MRLDKRRPVLRAQGKSMEVLIVQPILDNANGLFTAPISGRVCAPSCPSTNVGWEMAWVVHGTKDVSWKKKTKDKRKKKRKQKNIAGLVYFLQSWGVYFDSFAIIILKKFHFFAMTHLHYSEMIEKRKISRFSFLTSFDRKVPLICLLLQF